MSREPDAGGVQNQGVPRILWLSHLLPYPPQGGALQRSYHLIRGAASAGRLDLVTFRQRALHPDSSSLGHARSELERFLRIEGVFDLPVDRSPWARRWLLASSVLTPNPYTVRWNTLPELDEHLGELAGTRRYDLVHFDTIGMLQYRRHFPDAAWVLNHHNVESQMLASRARESGPLASLYLRWEARRLGRWERDHGQEADVHIVVSEVDRERLQTSIPGAIVEVVDNPADVEFFRPDGDEKLPGSVVFVGRIDAYTNAAAVRWIRDAIWPRLKSGGVAKSLSIVGRDPPEDIVAWGRSDPGVTVSGFVEDVRPWMNRSEVYICPIRHGGGTRLKLLDAMAMALPVVSHTFAIEGLDVIPGEHVLVADDVEGIARAVERLLGDRELARDLGRRARERVEALYSVPAVRARLAAAYERALELRRRGARRNAARLTS